MTETEPWTIKRLLDWTTDFFKSKKLESARLSAEILLAEALNCQRIDLYTRFNQVPEENRLATYRDWVKRHATGEPVAYLAGHREFFSLKFLVNSKVLIPRPETEHVVTAAIDAAKILARKRVCVVDVGTGSGCIAVALAKHLPDCRVLATDISPEALDIARLNAASHRVQDQLDFVLGDLLDAVPADVQPDIIVSNPPYIGRKEIDTVDKSVRDYEPEIALFAGDEGCDVIRRLVRQSAQRLAVAGFLIFESSPIIFDRSLEIVCAEPLFGDPETIRDYSGHRRVIQVRKVC